MKIGVCILCLIAVLTAFECGDSAAVKVSPVQPDAHTSWSMIGFGREWGIRFNSIGSFDLKSSGEVAGGTAYEFGVDRKKFTGGKVVISDKGSVSGFIDTYLADSDTHEKYMILDGQLTPDKDMIVFEGRFPTDRRGIVILIAKNETFAQADMTGTWTVLHDGAYSIDINKEGTITGCERTPGEGTGMGMCEGSLSLDPTGAVSADMLFSGKKNAPVIVKGQLNSGKNLRF